VKVKTIPDEKIRLEGTPKTLLYNKLGKGIGKYLSSLVGGVRITPSESKYQE